MFYSHDSEDSEVFPLCCVGLTNVVAQLMILVTEGKVGLNALSKADSSTHGNLSYWTED